MDAGSGAGSATASASASASGSGAAATGSSVWAGNSGSSAGAGSSGTSSLSVSGPGVFASAARISSSCEGRFWTSSSAVFTVESSGFLISLGFLVRGISGGSLNGSRSAWLRSEHRVHRPVAVADLEPEFDGASDEFLGLAGRVERGQAFRQTGSDRGREGATAAVRVGALDARRAELGHLVAVEIDVNSIAFGVPALD